MKIKKLIIYACVAVVNGILLTACSTPKDIAYFQDLSDRMEVITTAASMIKVEPGDKLSIVVKSKDPALAELFNLNVVTSRLGQGGGSATNNNSTELRSYSTQSEGLSDYTVSAEGNIDFPILGKLHIEGMTRQEVAGYIKGELMGRNLIKDPTVTVEFLSAGVNVLGEVNRPGRYDINKDRITILDAIALAGDLNINGQRTNVRVLREENGKVVSYIVDLTDAKGLLSSPVYYMKQNDVIYVEPNGLRKRTTVNNANNVMNASFWVSIASAIASIAVLIFK